MLILPKKIDVKNKKHFKKYFLDRCLCYLRRDIYEHILSNDETSYFDIEKFNTKYVKNIGKTNELIDKIIIELKTLGWKCKKSFGSTGLFIYSTEKPPSNCWEDEF